MNLARCQCEEIVRQAASTIKRARLRLFAVIPDRSQRGSNARRAHKAFPFALIWPCIGQRHELCIGLMLNSLSYLPSPPAQLPSA